MWTGFINWFSLHEVEFMPSVKDQIIKLFTPY